MTPAPPVASVPPPPTEPAPVVPEPSPLPTTVTPTPIPAPGVADPLTPEAFRSNALKITPAVTGAAALGTYYSDVITVTGLPPGVSIHCIATGAGFVDAAAEALTGTYREVVDVFQASPSGSFVFQVAGVASATPGATVIVTVSFTTFTGYGATFQSGTNHTAEFSITTRR